MKEVICKNNSILQGNDTKPNLELDKKYEVQLEYTCKCGQIHYNIGLKSDLNYVSCYKCRENLPDGNKIHWCNSVRFIETL